MNHEVSTEFRRDDDEIDLIELLMILVREKKTIAITTIIVTLMALGGALFERNASKKVQVILTPKIKNFKQGDILVGTVLEKAYTKNDVRAKSKQSLDEFRDEFKISGIIPKDIEDSRAFLAKSGGTLEYTPTSYKIDLRVGSIGESKAVLDSYITELNSYYRTQKESTYRFKNFDSSILDDKKYNYEDYIAILESRKAALKALIAGREKEKLDYVSYGFGYRELQIELNNLENIRIQNLKNYLLATNIVRDKDKFSSEFVNRQFRLETEIKEKKEVANNYKNLLNSYKVENSTMVIPKGVKITLGDNEKEKYYVELMNNYLKTEKEVLTLEETLKELIYISKNLKTGTESEQQYIMESLRKIIASYNSIVALANQLEAKENYITNGELIKVASPVEVVSNSKAKLILAVGVVMGVFLGVMMAFMKNFYHSFKKASKGMMAIAMFLFLGVNSYSKEEITIGFTHKEIKEGLNPDRTPFDLNETLIKNYFIGALNLDVAELNKISITPIYPLGSIKTTESRLKAGEKGYLYLPTEYLVTLNLSDSKLEKEVADKLRTEFPKFYVESFLNLGARKVSYLDKYDSYRDTLGVFTTLINGLKEEIAQRREKAPTTEIFYEYNNLAVELNKIVDVTYRDTLNFIKSNNFVKNIDVEKVYLIGENRYINLSLESLKVEKKTYENVLKNYSTGERGASILESGDLAMSGDSGLREKQYIDISKQYLGNLNKENSLKIKLIENERSLKEMRLPTEAENSRIESELGLIQDELNSIVDRMVAVELKDYRREYVGSVKVF